MNSLFECLNVIILMIIAFDYVVVSPKKFLNQLTYYQSIS